jgi:hypothetical protein
MSLITAFTSGRYTVGSTLDQPRQIRVWGAAMPPAVTYTMEPTWQESGAAQEATSHSEDQCGIITSHGGT